MQAIIYTHTTPLSTYYHLHGSFSTTTQTHHATIPATLTISRPHTPSHCAASLRLAPSHAPLYLILAYSARPAALRIFYQQLPTWRPADIRVVIAAPGPLHQLAAAELARDAGLTEGHFAHGHLLRVVSAPSPFSRASALQAGLAAVPPDSLVFLCDVDMAVSPTFFDKCRLAASPAETAYFPVVYSMYPYGRRVAAEHGYWREGGYGMVCAYRADILRVAPWQSRQFSGWGLEDVALYQAFVADDRVNVFRAVEPALVHRWHPKVCEGNPSLPACLGTVLRGLGSQRFLAAVVAARGVDVRKVAYVPAPVLYGNDTPPVSSGAVEEFTRVYERTMAQGKGGLLSVFAAEARERLAKERRRPITGGNVDAAMPLSLSALNAVD